MSPPPGYAAYEGTDFRQWGFKRIRGLATAIFIILGIAAAGQLLAAATTGSARDAARDYLDNVIDEDEFNEKLAVSGLGSLLGAVAMIALVVISIIWLYRLTSNHQKIGRALTWGAGWAIAGWVLPPFLFVIPLLMLREAWKASDPGSPPGSTTWKNQPESPLPWIWFVLYSLIPLALSIAGGWQMFTNFDRDADNVAERMLDVSSGLTILTSLTQVLAAVSWGLLVWNLTKRHTQLTGEATAR